MTFWRGATALLVLFGVQAVAPAQAVNEAAKPNDPQDNRFLLWYRNYDSPQVRALVSLALQKTPEYGPYVLARSPEMSQGRALRELADENSDLVHIANVASNSERERELVFIPLPIDGGLLGLRVCVIRQNDLELFRGVTSIKEFAHRRIRVGQGTHWPDTEILRVNGIDVVTHSRYEILFRMLDNDRFECFARGVSEVLYDLRLVDNRDYIIEPNLLIAYAMPSYLFVGSHRQDIAHRLQLGIERAIVDGSFGDYLDRFYNKAIDFLNLESRHILVLDNPFLSEDSWKVSERTLENLRERIDRLKE